MHMGNECGLVTTSGIFAAIYGGIKPFQVRSKCDVADMISQAVQILASFQGSAAQLFPHIVKQGRPLILLCVKNSLT